LAGTSLVKRSAIPSLPLPLCNTRGGSQRSFFPYFPDPNPPRICLFHPNPSSGSIIRLLGYAAQFGIVLLGTKVNQRTSRDQESRRKRSGRIPRPLRAPDIPLPSFFHVLPLLLRSLLQRVHPGRHLFSRHWTKFLS